MFEQSGYALSLILEPQMILLILGATLLGMAASIIPGLSSGKMLALSIPFTYAMDVNSAVGFLAALMAAGGFAGSLTSILLGVPGDGINAATVLDGHPLARKGRAGEAIGASATASALGALIGVFVLVASIPIVRSVILLFGPPEFFALSVAGVLLIATVSSREPLKGVISGLMGMAFGLVGLNVSAGAIRYTFGIRLLEDGIRLIPVLLALFAVPVIIDLFRENTSVSRVSVQVEGSVMAGVRAVLSRWWLLTKSAVTGTVIGMMPGVGGSVASWVAYFGAQRSSKSPLTFGEGNIEGVIGPEAANDAKDGGQILTFLALGIPTGVSTAILLGAFQIHGIFPGRNLFENRMDIIWIIIFALIISNVLTSVWGLMFVRWIMKLTQIPASVLVPTIAAVCALGAYADLRNFFGIVMLIIMGILGTVMIRFGYSAPPFLVGLILLPLAESNFFLSRQISRGTYVWLTRPLTIAIFVVTILGIFGPPLVRRFRRASISDRLNKAQLRELDALDIDPDAEDVEDVPALATDTTAMRLSEIWLLGIVATASIWGWIESLSFREGASLVPRIVFTALILTIGMRLVTGLRAGIGHGRVDVQGDEKQVQFGLVYVSLWLLLLPALIWALGMVIGIGLYVVVFPILATNGLKTAWIPSLVKGVGMAVFLILLTQLVFTDVLGIRFPSGAVLEFFEPSA